MANNDMIAHAMDVQPLTTQPVLELVVKEDGYDTSKDALEKALATGVKALGELSKIATDSSDPRAYRVMTELITAIASSSRELVEIRKTAVETKIKEEGAEGPQTVNQNLIVSTAELAQILKDINDKNS